jgi:phosphoethanolamine N-methyltransferase
LISQLESQELFSHLPDLKGKKVLELASGIGRFTRHFSTQASHLTSVDLTPTFIEKNRADHADCFNVTWICSNVMNLKMPDASFDFIFFNWLLMYLTNRETRALLHRIHKWLKPGGELFFRESCDLKRTKCPIKQTFYRPPSYYDNLISDHFVILKTGYLKSYIGIYGNPFQEFWHALKIKI